MKDKHSVASSNNSTVLVDGPINIRRILIKHLNYWPLFAISMLVALSAAFFYTKYAPHVYDVMATLMIKDSNEQNTPKSTLVDFQALEQVNAPKVVKNEIEVLKSNQLIKEVVDHFQLWASYKLKGGIIKDQDLYKKSPVTIDFINGPTPLPTQKINIRILDSNTFSLLSAKDGEKKIRYNESFTNSGCTWSITKNENFDKYIGDEVQIDISDPKATVLSYQNRLIVEPQEEPATVINISLSDANLTKAEDFINYLVFCYKRSDIAEKSKITKSTLDFIDRRLALLSGQLSNAESNMGGYRSANGLADLNTQSQIYLEDMQSNSAKLNDIKTQLNIIERLENYLNQAGNNDRNVPSTVGIDNQHLTELIQKLSNVKLERNKLLATLPEKNPAFEPIDRQIASLKQEINEDIAGLKSSLTTMQQSVESYKSAIQTSIKSVPVQEHQLIGMGRQQSTKSSLYDYLLQQREAISLSFASSASEVRYVDAAHMLPQKATKKLMPFGVAFFLGLIFPVGFIYGRSLIRNNVTSRKEIEELTGASVIAETSHIKLPSSIAFAHRDNPESFPLIEQFRHLRTKVGFLNNSKPGEGFVILLTSSVANEGKSMTSVNLAVALASSGKKTLLIEADTYKPTLLKMFDLSATAGLTGYLNAKANLKDIVQPTKTYPDLSIIDSGAFSDNFSELLDRDLFGELVNTLRKEYDYILFDSPPVHPINDAYAIAKQSDLTLYMVRYDHTSNSLLPFIQEIVANESLPAMHIVFNGLLNGRDSQGYKYERYYKSAVV
jgi:capsular exopolysaccharide synthesis family protein